MNSRERLGELAKKLGDAPDSALESPQIPETTKKEISAKVKKGKMISRKRKSIKAENQKEEKQNFRKLPKPKEEPFQYGEKGDFVKANVTLPPEVYKQVVDEVTRRKLAKEKEAVVSAVIRDAVVEKYGKKKG